MAQEISAKSSVVVTIRKSASEAGLAALRQGGNAVDAAVAAAMVLCVVSPTNVGFGGYGGTMAFYDAKANRVRALDFDSVAPRAYRPDLYHTSAPAQHGYLALGVPAMIAGFDAALRNFGKLKWSDVSRHAADIAENGFPTDTVLANELRKWAATADKASLAAILPDGKPPAVGEPFRLPDLAKLIRSLESDPRAFYTGEPAKLIAKQVQANGGILSEADMAAYEPQIVEPLSVSYRGYELFTPPPPSGGITSLSILKTLERVNLADYDPWGAPYYELFAGASMLSWQERARWLGDPKFVDVPMARMLSAEAAAERFDRICRGDVAPPPDQPPLPPAGEHTCNVLAADAEGNAVSLTVTHGESFGARVAIEGLGLFLGHGMSRFDYKPGAPNAPQPGKRMQHNMCPTVVLKDGRPHALVGLVGGPKIVTVTAQQLVNVLDFGASAGDSASAPRIHVEQREPVLVTPNVPWEVAAEMVLMGHNVKGAPAIGGPANVVRFHDGGRSLTAACSAGTDGVMGI